MCVTARVCVCVYVRMRVYAYVWSTFPLVMQLVEKFSAHQVLKVFNNSLSSSSSAEGAEFSTEFSLAWQLPHNERY